MIDEEAQMPDGKPKDTDTVMTLIPGKDAVKALDNPAAMRALCEDACAALAIEPEPPEPCEQ